MVYDTEDPTRIAQMNDEMRVIESMVIVGVLKYTAAGKEHGSWRDSPAGFGVTLRCKSARDHGACGKKAVGPVRLNSTSRPTLLDCLKELRQKLEEEHGSRCLKAVNEHADITQDNAPTASQNALRTLVDLSHARQCLEKATKEWKNVKERADARTEPA